MITKNIFQDTNL